MSDVASVGWDVSLATTDIFQIQTSSDIISEVDISSKTEFKYNKFMHNQYNAFNW